MSINEGIFLGVLQGLTEFFPVSSSGHLALAQSLLPNFTQPGVLFDVLLHLATLLAVVVYFRKDILSLFSSNWKWLIYLVVGTIPAGLVGVLFKDIIEGMFTNIKLIGGALIFTGIILFISDRFKKTDKKLNWGRSLIIGIGQALAITPGISRSGATMCTGIFCGVERGTAFKFSFLLSIPAILGAVVLESGHLVTIGRAEIGPYLSGMLFAFLFGYLALVFLSKIVLKKKFTYFAVYCWILGIVSLLLI